MPSIYLWIVLSPLVGCLLAGFGGQRMSRVNAHRVAIAGVAIATVLSALVFYRIVVQDGPGYEGTWYTWAMVGGLKLEIGFLIDRLSATMMLVVSFVSLMVHIYTIGYMSEDPGYKRFFSYISLFTFSMLMLVMANNFLQLFFGWEAVGMVSYLLIGFWYTRPTAIHANLKAFLVNRVGDFGFLLGIGGVLLYAGSLHYPTVFAQTPAMSELSMTIWFGQSWSVLSVIGILLFVGAIGKSAQFPLHVWLPDSMEGPTPISALIHAATMVTAGIFMVARMSPIYELSETALAVVMLIGAITAFFMGLLGLVQSDIKRVVAYSTLSQLGYMTVALGASAYSVAIFHLFTHAFFKALLFLGAGSVIIAMHHDQDMRNMGGLRKYMPITWITSLAGSLALIGFPGFAGFYSKDSIIEAVRESNLPGAQIAYFAVLSGVFITALYTFRMYFMVFHGHPRMDDHTREHLRESPGVVTWPLILLAIPSVVIGAVLMDNVISGEHFANTIYVASGHDVLTGIAEELEHGLLQFTLHGFLGVPFWLAMAGVFVAWYLYSYRPELPAVLQQRMSLLHTILIRKYGFDELYLWLFAGGARNVGQVLWRVGDVLVIDGLFVIGSARFVGWWAALMRHIQSGYLYHYAFAMIIGLLVLINIFVGL